MIAKIVPVRTGGGTIVPVRTGVGTTVPVRTGGGTIVPVRTGVRTTVTTQTWRVEDSTYEVRKKTATYLSVALLAQMRA